jgi:hypothetical protein
MYLSATRKLAAARSPVSIASLTMLVAFLRLGLALTGLSIAERGLTAPFRNEDLRLLLALGAQDCRLAQLLRLEHRGTLLTLCFHLPGHSPGEVGRRDDILGFDAGDLGGFKWSSQHGLCELFGGAGPEPRPVFSSPGSFAACC